MKNTHYLKSNPIKNWKISEDCERFFLATDEKKERWKKIISKLPTKPV